MLSRAIITLLSGYAYVWIQREQKEKPVYFLMKLKISTPSGFCFLYGKNGRQCQPLKQQITIAPAKREVNRSRRKKIR